MQLEQVCDEISGELEDAARWLAAGGLSEREFRCLLDIFGKRKSNGSELKISGYRSPDGGVHFTLRTAADALFLVMDFDPCAGKLMPHPPCWGS